MIRKTKRHFVLLICLACGCLNGIAQNGSGSETGYLQTETGTTKRYKPSRVESKADRFFIRGDYDRAMRIYERAYGRAKEYSEHQVLMELKLARLYTLLLRDAEAIGHFERLYERVDTMLSINDVCSYVDALRRSDKAQEAEIVARHYAFQYPYSRNQRYLNTLNSLSDQRHYYGVGDSDFSVRKIEISSPRAEYWIGEILGKVFYTVSNSPIQDPRKIYYHQTEFFALNGTDDKAPFYGIPRDLQSGPMVYSPDERFVVASNITYRAMDRIQTPGETTDLFVTRLYFSEFDAQRNRWSNFAPLFPQEDGASYAHPVFVDNGRTLMFSSDRNGGYGGMDLYTVSWDETQGKWGDPVNLGPVVNTEGDEIYPRVSDGVLYFSSNGQEGYGGYDMYRVSYDGHIILPGSLFHYPYPVNTVYNDFGMYMGRGIGYFISDRSGLSGKDDIYVFDNAVSPLSSRDAIGVSPEYSAMAGKLNLIHGLSSNTEIYARDLTRLTDNETYELPEQNSVLLSVYFDFDSAELDSEATGLLDELLEMPGMENVVQLNIVGYADDFGSAEYNMQLSEERAQQTAEYLLSHGLKCAVVVHGKGRTRLDIEEYKDEVLKNYPKADFVYMPNLEYASFSNFLSRKDLIKINRKARRVEIVVSSVR